MLDNVILWTFLCIRRSGHKPKTKYQIQGQKLGTLFVSGLVYLLNLSSFPDLKTCLRHWEDTQRKYKMVNGIAMFMEWHGVNPWPILTIVKGCPRTVTIFKLPSTSFRVVVAAVWSTDWMSITCFKLVNLDVCDLQWCLQHCHQR